LCFYDRRRKKEDAKAKEGDKKEEKKEAKKEKKVRFFVVEQDQFVFTEFTAEGVKKIYGSTIVCNTDEKVKEAAKKFLKKESTGGCSGLWWLLVIPVVGGIGVGAYYALKEEDDETEVDEYDAAAYQA